MATLRNFIKNSLHHCNEKHTIQHNGVKYSILFDTKDPFDSRVYCLMQGQNSLQFSFSLDKYRCEATKINTTVKDIINALVTDVMRCIVHRYAYVKHNAPMKIIIQHDITLND